jgi:hypothetical protein
MALRTRLRGILMAVLAVLFDCSLVENNVRLPAIEEWEKLKDLRIRMC